MVAFLKNRMNRKASLLQYHARLKLCKGIYLRNEAIRLQKVEGARMLCREWMRLKMLKQLKNYHTDKQTRLVELQAGLKMAL